MNWQIAITALLVGACAVYALWTLLPAVLRRRLAARLGRPAAAAGGCGGCDSCGSPAPPPAGEPTEQVIRIVKRPPAP
jgi:hypothetical protein